jgi:hypothetical protein
MPTQTTPTFCQTITHIDRRLRASGLLKLLSPADLQTLICLLTYANGQGICILSGRDVADALRLSEKQVRTRLKRLLQSRFQGMPLVMKIDLMRTQHGRFAKSRYRISSLPGIAIHHGSSRVGKPDVDRSASAGTGTPLPPGETVRFHIPGRRLGKLSSGIRTVTPQGEDVVVNKYNKTTQQTGRGTGETKALSLRQRELVTLLQNLGVTEITAREIAERYSPELIESQIKMLSYRQARDPAAMLVKAIRDDWDAPSAYIAAMHEQTRKRQQEKAKAAEEARRKAHERRVEQALSRLSPAEKDELIKRARREVRESLKGAMDGQLPESLVNAQAKKIISEEYLDEPTGEGYKNK